MKKKNVRIVLEVDEKLRAELKARSAKQYMTLKSWLIAAISEKMRKEEEES